MAFTGRNISFASRSISWAMLINITITPMLTGLIKTYFTYISPVPYVPKNV